MSPLPGCRRLLLVLVLGVGFPTAAPAQHYQIVSKPAQEIEGVYRCTVRLPNFSVNEWLAFLPYPPDLDSQEEIHVSVWPSGSLAYELSPLQRPVVRAVYAGLDEPHRHEMTVQATYRATLKGRHLVHLDSGQPQPKVPALTEEERKAALSTTPTYDYTTEPFQTWLTAHHLRRRTGETDLQFARRAYDFIRTNFDYTFRDNLDRRSSAVCVAGASDCGGLSKLFVSTLRANEIPARALAGRLARSRKANETLQGAAYYAQHVRAEFFAGDIGWVPVDVTYGRRDPSADATTYFGNDPGDLLVMHLDADLSLPIDPVRIRERSSLQGIYYRYHGRGSTLGKQVTIDWQVRVLHKFSP